MRYRKPRPPGTLTKIIGGIFIIIEEPQRNFLLRELVYTRRQRLRLAKGLPDPRSHGACECISVAQSAVHRAQFLPAPFGWVANKFIEAWIRKCCVCFIHTVRLMEIARNPRRNGILSRYDFMFSRECKGAKKPGACLDTVTLAWPQSDNLSVHVPNHPAPDQAKCT